MKIQNATVRGTVACRQLDGGNTAVFVHSGTETQTNLAGTSKNPERESVKAFGIFSYYRYQIKADHRMVVRCVLCAGGGEAHDQGD